MSCSTLDLNVHRLVSSAFIVDVQSKLEPDPNETAAAYMCILIHVVNDSLFPDVDPNSITWTGPPAEIITIQSLLYASIATSLFAAFLAMVGSSGSTDISGTVRVPLPTRATTDGGSRMDSRSGTSSPSLKSFRQCSRLYCRCQGSPYHRATGLSAAPSTGSSVHSRFQSPHTHPSHSLQPPTTTALIRHPTHGGSILSTTVHSQ